jgi:peroxiredoxin
MPPLTRLACAERLPFATAKVAAILFPRCLRWFPASSAVVPVFLVFYSRPMGTSATLKLGDRVPDFVLFAANRPGPWSLEEARQRGPVIVEFLRGTWCPNCKKRMAQMENYQQEFAGLGLSLVYVAAEKRGGIFHPERYLKQYPVAYPFLLDEDRMVTKAYGVYHRLAKDALHIARPATFLVDTQGIARWIYVGQSQTDRAPLEPVLEAVRSLGRKKAE